MAAPIVFFDIAGPDPAAQASFYRAVFDWDIAPDGSFAAPFQPSLRHAAGVGGQLRTDPAEKVLYIGVEDVTAVLGKIAANGGTIAAPRFEVPGVVVLGLFADPAGNRLGLIEMADGEPVVPQ